MTATVLDHDTTAVPLRRDWLNALDALRRRAASDPGNEPADPHTPKEDAHARS